MAKEESLHGLAIDLRQSSSHRAMKEQSSRENRNSYKTGPKEPTPMMVFHGRVLVTRKATTRAPEKGIAPSILNAMATNDGRTWSCRARVPLARNEDTMASRRALSSTGNKTLIRDDWLLLIHCKRKATGDTTSDNTRRNMATGDAIASRTVFEWKRKQHERWRTTSGARRRRHSGMATGNTGPQPERRCKRPCQASV